jgi:hypothetical protein
LQAATYRYQIKLAELERQFDAKVSARRRRRINQPATFSTISAISGHKGPASYSL